MKSVIVGTAGHIDHGKTALVKALTGIDADRLEEEKRRGITIDIGFAHLELPGADRDTLRLGFVDVPGHERFVRNMLAGVGGIDLVLLVIAADESIKPQTREHFDICRLLSVKRGITVLTKSDLVDRDTLEVVRLEVEDFVRGSFLDVSQAPIIPVSALSGVGIEELKRALISVTADIPAHDSTNLARLPIDRVFTMKGFGTVVTGTLASGAVRKEDDLELFPRGQRVRVRGVQVHGQPANQAIAGERTALNLAGISTEELSRGMTLAPAETFRATTRLDAELFLLDSAKALRDRARVHFHSYTSETIATVHLSGKNQLEAGESSFAQLRLAHPVLLLPGDRFIIRQFSPVVTIGGGRVLENSPPLRPQKAASYSEFMTTLSGSDDDGLHARLKLAGQGGLSLAEIVARTGWRPQQIIRTAAALTDVARIGEYLVLKTALAALANELLSTLDRFHKQNPLVAGMSKEALRAKFPRISEQVFARVVDAQVLEKKLELAEELVKLPGRGVLMKDDEAQSQKLIENAFASAGLKVPAMKEVLAGLKVDRIRAQKIVTLLLREKVLIKVSEDLLFHKDALNELRKRMAERKAKSSRIDVAQFKDLAGVTRKYAIPLLEYLDREHVTRRVGDERMIL
jgi:selenocysteine-specific elongation factor